MKENLISEENSLSLLYVPARPALCASILYKFIVPMPSAINSTNFSSLVSTALLARLERDRMPYEGDKNAGSLAKLSDVRTD